MNFLLVEDHPIFRLGVRHLLTQRWPDARIAEADTLVQAAEQARTLEPDAAIVDLNLPDADGVEAVASLHRAAPGMRLLVLSLHDEEAYARHVLRMGAMGYLTKDHTSEELISALETVLSGGRYISKTLVQHMAQSLMEEHAAVVPVRHNHLGAQEYRVMLQIAAGKRITDIAQGMHLSPKTISTYRTRIFEKLGVTSNVQLARYCLDHRLLEPQA